MDPYENIGKQKDAVREMIERHEDFAECFLTFSSEFENMWGYNLGVFKHKSTEVVVLARDEELIVTDSRTISRFSRIEAEYEFAYGLPKNIEAFIYEADITAPKHESR